MKSELTTRLDAMFERVPLPDASCPVCDSVGLERFFRVAAVPAHSVVLLESHQQAMDVPTGDIHLCLCEFCGSITNVAFRDIADVYNAKYEETQGYSPTFSRYVAELAQQLIAEFDLRDKTILEIGCGKGQFVTAMCEFGMKSGLGIDPSYVDGRIESPAVERVSYIKDFYGEAYAHLDADLFCCRHTLEHVAAPFEEIVKPVAKAIADRERRLLILDVPDTRRLLAEGAFWDVYHEHCNYFTGPSLTTL
jgi:hypothetical protein